MTDGRANSPPALSPGELATLREVQERLTPYRPKPGEPLISEQLIAERRAEAVREAEDV